MAKLPALVDAPAPSVPFYSPQTIPSSGTLLSTEQYPQNDKKPLLFKPIRVRDVEIKNRIWVAPMCQYSAAFSGPLMGAPTDWHLVHLGAFAVRGAGLVMVEATGVAPNGRISPQDLGIWSDEHIPAFKRLVDFMRSQGAVTAIQLAHAGRKASTAAPWLLAGVGRQNLGTQVVPKEEGGWPDDVWGPAGGEESRFSQELAVPIAMTEEMIEKNLNDWVAAAKRADAAGFDVIEIHGAHGYLLSSFLSPISNTRTDKWGGQPLENRFRYPLEVARRLRSVWPSHKPLFFRVSATEWDARGEKDSEGRWQSWGIEQTVLFAKELQKIGVDLIDVSSGGNYEKQSIPVKPGFQVPFAERVRSELGEQSSLKVGTVGLITAARQAEDILQDGKADAIFLARELLRNVDFVAEAAVELGVAIAVPHQYQRSHTRMIKPGIQLPVHKI